jgi:hypothetical protein
MEKRCTKCGELKLAEAFPLHKTARDKRGSWCRQCCKEYRSLQRKLNPEKAHQVDKESREKYKQKRKETRRKYLQRPEVKQKEREHARQYYQRHKEQVKARERAKTRESPGRSTKYVDEWRKEHLQVARLSGRMASQRRRSRESSLACTFTAQDWERCQDYWHNACAICGRTPDARLTLAQDHWIPLNDARSDNPGTTKINILPLCHGADGCNNHKFAREPVEWLMQMLGEDKALKKLREIEVYFQWVGQKEG